VRADRLGEMVGGGKKEGIKTIRYRPEIYSRVGQ
jgi:hypothetical protein